MLAGCKALCFHACSHATHSVSVGHLDACARSQITEQTWHLLQAHTAVVQRRQKPASATHRGFSARHAHSHARQQQTLTAMRNLQFTDASGAPLFR